MKLSLRSTTALGAGMKAARGAEALGFAHTGGSIGLFLVSGAALILYARSDLLRFFGTKGPFPMIYDHRTYTCHPGRIKQHLKLYETYGWAAQQRHLGKPIFYGAVETGDVNSYVHIWAYRDAADRATKRAALAADPDWQEYLRRSAESGNLLRQVNTIMTPAPFFEAPA